MSNVVNHPNHYNQHPAGVEARLILERMTFNTGNALKYIWRAKHKGNERLDLEKARNYIEREIELIEEGDIEFVKNSFSVPHQDISLPFGDLCAAVGCLLFCEFYSINNSEKVTFLKKALSELNLYLDNMPEEGK